GKRMRWIGLAGEPEEAFARRGMSGLLERQLRDGVSRYCGIDDAELTVLHGTLTRDDLRPAVDEVVDSLP
ncbi:MAG: NADPH oxidoreductase, partial [Saccharothrix sp.]|nr:NADPH oxidoreductase [Saccharothrix sp.]